MSKSAVEIANQMLLVIDEYKTAPVRLKDAMKDDQTFTSVQKSIAISSMRDSLLGKLEGMAVALAIVCEEGE